MTRNTYIQNKSLKTFFIASVLISAISQINTLIDGVIVSHFVSPAALSAISLTAPIMSILYMFADMVSLGASILVAKEIGMQNYGNVSRIFTSSMLTTIIVTGLIAVGLLLFSGQIASLLATDIQLLPLLQNYLPIAFIGSIVVVVDMLAMMYLKLSGRPELVNRAVIISSVANILLDLVFVGLFSMGISGAAWATTISVFISVLYLVPFLIQKDSMLSWIKPESSWVYPYSKSTAIQGVSSAVNSISVAVLYALLNLLILKTKGTDGLFVLSIGMQILMISIIILDGTADAITGIGGVMLGENDIDGYRSMVSGILKKCLIGFLIFTLVIWAVPDLFAKVFGATDEMLTVVRNPLRIISTSLIPLGIIILLDSAYLLQGHNTFSSIIQVLYLAIIIPSVFLSSVFCPEYLWYSIPFGVLAMLLIVVCYSFVISRKDKNLNWLTLISKYPNDPGMSLSVNYDTASVQEAIGRIHIFLDICELNKDLYYKIDSCLDELTSNLISMTEETGKQGSFDLRVVDDGKKILITMKDDGKPYNPILKYNAAEGCDIEEVNLALVILNAFCPDLNYKYMNGINCVYMNFPYSE